jgi:hypothetical protein
MQRSTSSANGGDAITSALGRFLPVVTIRDFSNSATCYAAPNGRERPGAAGRRYNFAARFIRP